jgi:hypothetical protein
LSLFQPPQPRVAIELAKLDVDALTPRQALDKLYELKDLVE